MSIRNSFTNAPECVKNKSTHLLESFTARTHNRKDMVAPQNYYYLPENVHAGTKAMMFIDGENLAIRYGEMLGSANPQPHVAYLPDVFVWSRHANAGKHVACEIIRRYYYTAAQGDELKIEAVEEQLKSLGIEAPRVFKKQKNRRSKRVDISLATDMLSHAHRGNYDLAILVGGDEDYVPLIQAVMAEGRRVIVWALPSGLSPTLARAADHLFNIGHILLGEPRDVSVRWPS
jgi:hypothetical protein